MATINTTGAGGNADRLNPTIQSTLGRLGRALTIRDGKGAEPARPTDTVQISPSASSAASPAAGLGQIGALLADLESLVAQAAQDNAGADVRAEAQRRIDEAVATISQIAGAGSVGEVGSRLDSAPGYSVVNRHDSISDVAVSSELKDGERFDVVLNVLHSAHGGGFFLSFGGLSIDLGTGSSMVFEISGVEGDRTVSFASGTTLNDISAAINTFEDVTGVKTSVSGTGIRLDSAALGGDQFVGIRVIDHGTIARSGGIFALDEDNPQAAITTGAELFRSQAAEAGLTDFGRDFEAEINGLAAEVDGNRFSASLLGGRVDVSFDFEQENRSSYADFFPGIPEQIFTVIGGQPQPSFLSDRNELVGNVRIENRALGQGEKFEIELDSYTQAKRAGVFLKLASFTNSPIAAGTITFEIDGPDGAASFSLVSGQPLNIVAAEINAISNELGVQAAVSGPNLRVVSNEFGDQQHISLRILESDFYRGTAGRLWLNHDGSPEAERTFITIDGLAASGSPIEDSGRDVQAYARGINFTSVGRNLVGDALGGDIHFEFDLGFNDSGSGWREYGIPRLTDFYAFTINGLDGVPVDGPIDDIPLPGPSPVAQALAPFTSTGASSGDFVAALDAIRALREGAGPAVTDDALASLRRDLIAGAGASLGINAASDAQRALDLLSGGDS